MPSIAPPDPARLIPVSVSLITHDGRFRTSNEGLTHAWRCRDADALRGAFSDARTLRGEDADGLGHMREAFYLDPESPWLYLMLTGGEAASLENVVAIELTPDDDVWDDSINDWTGATALLKEITVAACERGHDALLSTDPATSTHVICRTGHTTRGDSEVHVEANFSVAHPVWEQATRRGDTLTLAAPLCESTVAAAGGLMAIAMASQGLRPVDVYVTYVRGDDGMHRIDDPSDRPAADHTHPSNPERKTPWLRRILRREKLSETPDLAIMFLGLGRDIVEDCDPRAVVDHLLSLRNDPKELMVSRERFELVFEGYDRDPRDLWEIPEVRRFAKALDDAFPYWFYFLQPRGTGGLQVLTLCLIGERDASGAGFRLNADAFHDLVMRRWIPALNELCHEAGVSEDEVNAMTKRALEHIRHGGDAVA